MITVPVLSVNIRGEAEVLVADHQSVKTAFRKTPITQAVYLGMEGLNGDTVNDKKHHGGNDKALCCYNSEHFKYWKDELGFDLQPSAFGENLTLAGSHAHESNVCIGDRYQLGEAIVEVSEPRGPCFIIGIRYNYKQFPVHLQQTGFTGFYLRTIQPGIIRPGDPLIHISAHPWKISVLDVNRIRYHEPQNTEWLLRLSQLEVLTAEWRERFGVLLAKALR